MVYLTVKICLLGAQGVGKSCLAVRFVENTFDEKSASTIGASFLSKDMRTKDGSLYRLQIWDTAGQERYVANTLPTLYQK